MDSGSLFHFLHHCGIRDFWTLVSILTQSTTDLYRTWRNDWRRQDIASTFWDRSDRRLDPDLD